MGGWGCPHEDHGQCLKVPGKACDPGMKGCTLSGRFLFSSDDKNISRRLDEKKKNRAGKDGSEQQPVKEE